MPAMGSDDQPRDHHDLQSRLPAHVRIRVALLHAQAQRRAGQRTGQDVHQDADAVPFVPAEGEDRTTVAGGRIGGRLTMRVDGPAGRSAGRVGGQVHLALVAVEDRLATEENILGHHAYKPRSCHSASTRALTAASITIGVPHSRLVSPGHLLVASMPILLPSPETGLAKSR